MSRSPQTDGGLAEAGTETKTAADTETLMVSSHRAVLLTFRCVLFTAAALGSHLSAMLQLVKAAGLIRCRGVLPFSSFFFCNLTHDCSYICSKTENCLTEVNNVPCLFLLADLCDFSTKRRGQLH